MSDSQTSRLKLPLQVKSFMSKATQSVESLELRVDEVASKAAAAVLLVPVECFLSHSVSMPGPKLQTVHHELACRNDR